MLAVQIAVGVHHLRLDPDAKVHAQRVYAIDHRFQAVRKLLRVHIPVAQAGVIVLALAEPSVIDDEPLHTQLGSLLRQGYLARFAHIEFRGFPGVIEHRP